MENKINKEDNLLIKITSDHLTIKTIDNREYAIDYWNFKKDNLDSIDSSFVSNIVSMAMTMVNKQEDSE